MITAKQRANRVWARRNLILRTATLSAFAIAMANSALGISLIIDEGQTEKLAMIMGVASVISAALMITLGVAGMRREWNHNFVPNAQVSLPLESREDFEIQSANIGKICNKNGIAVNIRANYTRDEMVLGFVDEGDAVLVRMLI